MTPDKDGWCYWGRDDKRPNAHDICDVGWQSSKGEWFPEEGLPKYWVSAKRRYRLKEKPMSPRVGDEVILKPMKVTEVYSHVFWTKDGSGNSTYHSLKDIAQIIPAKREFKPGDRVKWESKRGGDILCGPIKAIVDDRAWVDWDQASSCHQFNQTPGPIVPLSDLQHMEDER